MDMALPRGQSDFGADGFPRRCGILFSSEAVGGLERYAIELAFAMQLTATKPILVNLKARTPYYEDIVTHQVELHSGLLRSRCDVIGGLRLLRLLVDLHLDVLLINSNRQAMWPGAVFGKLLRIPVVLLYTHDHWNPHLASLGITSRVLDGVVAAGLQHRRYLCRVLKLRPSRVISVYPGLCLERLGSISKKLKPRFSNRNSPTVGIIAALRPEKDHENFIRAAALVVRRIPEAKFLIVGDGPRRANLERFSRELGLEAKVHFLGWQRVDEHLFEPLDVLVLSSLSEVFPAVILEAFAAGVPVVATDVGSVKEMFGSPPCGVTVPPADAPKLADGIIRLIEEDQLALKMSVRAQERVRYFSADRFCFDLLHVARQLERRKKKNNHPTIMLHRG